MRKLFLIFTALTTLMLLAGCGSSGSSTAGLNSKEAVRKAVVEHLSQRKGLDLDMSAMDVEIGDVSFKTNEAEASVSFRAKGSQTAAMTMQYQLERSGEGWKVKPKAPGAAGGGNPHGGGAPAVELPAPLPGTTGGGATLPPGHPPTTPGQGGTKQ